MVISIIAALDSKRGIGKDNKLLFKIPKDFKRMKNLSTGHPIIMGRKTFESIGKVLPNRTNIIVTRDLNYKFDGAVVANSLKEALEIAKKSAGSEEIFIFGGAQIFEQILPKVDRLYLTLVEGDFGADTFFPDYRDFQRIIKEESGSSGEYTYKFLDLEK